MESVVLAASDGSRVVGDYAGRPGSPGAVLLHMMPSTKESWREFSAELEERGFQSLAIDLRGHGESQGGPHGYKKFSDEEHQSSIRDAEAAVSFLKSRGATFIVAAGASIGANLALWYSADYPGVSKILLLSPGFDYRGIRVEPLVGKLRPDQCVYFAASRDDPYSAETAASLFGKITESVCKELRIFDRAGHGTNIFEKEPEFMKEAADWLSSSVPKVV